MDRKGSVVTALAFGLALLGATTSSADTRELLEAKVPFAFRAGGALLPAGDYLVREDTSDGTMLLLESKNGQHAVWLFTSRDTPTRPEPKQDELVFAKYGAVYYLRGLWTSEDHGFSLIETPLQARTARTHNAAPEHVRVPAARKKTS
jgi:hypothetical protein